MPKRQLQGTIVSDKGNKTVIVLVERQYNHPVYKKTVRSTKRYAAHDENNNGRVGDKVVIQESRPISKTKKWALISGATGENSVQAAPVAVKAGAKKAPAKTAAKKEVKKTAKK